MNNSCPCSAKPSMAYLAAPYQHDDPKVMRARLFTVTWVAAQMVEKGDMAYSPLTHNMALETYTGRRDFNFWSRHDLNMLKRCDRLVVLKLPGWEKSTGVTAEIAFAKEHKIAIEYIELPEEQMEVMLSQLSEEIDANHLA